MKTIGRIFVTGLLTLLPILATVYLVSWSFASAEQLVGAEVRQLLPDDYYVTGMGLAVACLVIFLVGLLMHTRPMRQLTGRAERVLLAIPVVRSIYAALRDFTALVVASGEGAPMQVVTVELPGLGMRLLGFVARSDLADLPEGIGRADEIAVYLPMSYMIGGYTVFLPRRAVTPVAMSREEAMKFALTAGIRSGVTRQTTQ